MIFYARYIVSGLIFFSFYFIVIFGCTFNLYPVTLDMNFYLMTNKTFMIIIIIINYYYKSVLLTFAVCYFSFSLIVIF